MRQQQLPVEARKERKARPGQAMPAPQGTPTCHIRPAASRGEGGVQRKQAKERAVGTELDLRQQHLRIEARSQRQANPAPRNKACVNYLMSYSLIAGKRSTNLTLLRKASSPCQRESKRGRGGGLSTTT